MTIYVKNVEATGVYGRFDLKQEFDSGINIVFGKNGAGKTTLLHIISNALSGNFARFTHLQFNSVTINLSDDHSLSISNVDSNKKKSISVLKDGELIFESSPQGDSSEFTFKNLEIEDNFYKDWIFLNSDKLKNDQHSFDTFSKIFHKEENKEKEPIVPVAYFPAFRTMIEAWMSAELKKESVDTYKRHRSGTWQELATERARDWFGGFTPDINFPSLIDIEIKLTDEIEAARMNVWKTDQSLLSDAFQETMAALSDNSEIETNQEELLAEINILFSKLEKSPLRFESRIDIARLRYQVSNLKPGEAAERTAIRVLHIYRNILKKTLDNQKKSFEAIQKYFSSVNDFFEGKNLTFKPDLPNPKKRSIGIQYNDGAWLEGLRTLSSGERQIMTLIYAATHMSKQEIVLIDEPEISLHVDWQRMLIRKMAEQMGDRQIIACTHSPVIGADHLDKMQELSLVPTKETSPIMDVEDMENGGIAF